MYIHGLRFAKCSLLGVTKLESRTLCRNLDRRGLTLAVMREQGRQRASVLVHRRFGHLCADSENAIRERKRMEELVPMTPPPPSAAKKRRGKRKNEEDEHGFRHSPSKRTKEEEAVETAVAVASGADPEVHISMSEEVIRSTLRSAGVSAEGQVRTE